MNRYWAGLIFIGVLLFVSGFSRDGAAETDAAAIEFRYEFETPLTPKEALQTIFDFKHLKAYSRGVHHLQQSHRKRNSHVALYEYRHAMFRTVIMFKRTLYRTENEIGVKMLSCWDNVPFMPELKQMTGRYKVSVSPAGKTMVRYRTVSQFESPPGRAYRNILHDRTVKFMEGLRLYLQEQHN